jgi:hypothetical protein
VKFEGGTGIATGKIVQHDPRIRNAWGDGATSFDVTIRFAKQDDGSIQGVMGRHDMPGIALPIRLTVREKLP